MILTKEQINRYLRHIIIPEISGPGQRILLESSVLIYGDNVENTSPLIYYMAAAGIGHIYCSFDDSRDFDTLFNNIHDLNNDVVIELINSKENEPLTNSLVRVIIGSPKFILSSQDKLEFIPTITALITPWRGMLKLFKEQIKFDSFIKLLQDQHMNTQNENYNSLAFNSGSTLSACFMGAVTVIECIKFYLAIGEALEKPLYFDLFKMEFVKLEADKTVYYIDKLLDPISTATAFSNDIDNSKILSGSKVLIVGTGGLGSPAALALSMAGVGTIGLIDYDNVDISNLNRQILHSYSRIGIPKVESAKAFIKNLKPDIKLITYNTDFNSDNALEIIKDYDVVIDGVDNFPTRYLLNDACFIADKPMVEAGVLRFDGLGMTIIPGKGPCYRCIFPEIPASGSVPSCSESGVLGPVPAVMGFIQAAETIKLLTGKGSLLDSGLIFFDALDMDFRIININKSPECPLCGTAPSIKELQKYDFTCNT